MSRFHNSLVLLFCLCAAPAAAFAAAPPVISPQTVRVAALIEQLGATDFREREAAERRLRAEGAAALPQLRRAMRHADLEVRRRALRLVPSIETEVQFSPKRVTFRVTNEPFKTVLAELSKASGYKLDDSEPVRPFGRAPVAPNPNAKMIEAQKLKTFTYDFVNVSFWDAVERVCKDAGLTISQQPGFVSDDVIRLSHGQGHSPFTSRSGPFRVVANSLRSFRHVDLGSTKGMQSRSEKLTLEFTVFAEPRLPLMHSGDVRLESAYDELKNTMLPRRETAEMFDEPFGFRGRGGFGRRAFAGNHKQLALPVSVPLERRSERATTLKKIKGVVPVTVLVKQEAVAISEKVLEAKGTKKEIGDLAFEIQDVTKPNANQVSVKFSIANKRGNDYSWQNSLYSRLEMYDDQGNKMQTWSSSWGGSGPNSVQMTLTFYNRAPKPGEPLRFVFQHWESKVYDVDFEFRDVPLP